MDLGKSPLFLVTFCALMQMYVGMSFRVHEDGGLSAEWQDPSVDTGLTEAVDALVKRSKALRFYGLMGKRSGKKGEMFVGLMGRSISGKQQIYELMRSHYV
uniref:Uncharacterized protein n=1 Tax=Neogobius melanostomus TaxID=47308 RepID=A0A8C6SZI3_9GOBI